MQPLQSLFTRAQLDSDARRVVVLQDRPRSIEYQIDLLQATARDSGLRIAVAGLDMRRPVEEILQRLAAVNGGVEWLVTDLLLDNVDASLTESRGVRVMEQLVDRQMFGRYVSRPVRGTRSIAVSSVAVHDGGVADEALARRLRDLGVDFQYLGSGGAFQPLARAICDELTGNRR